MWSTYNGKLELGKTNKITWEEISSCLIPEEKKQLYMPTDGGGGGGGGGGLKLLSNTSKTLEYF